MELIVLIIGLLIFGLGVILCITALFLGDFKDLIPSIITISLGIILIFNSDNLTITDYSKNLTDLYNENIGFNKMTEIQIKINNLKIILDNLQSQYDSLEYSHNSSASADRHFLNLDIQNIKNQINELENK